MEAPNLPLLEYDGDCGFCTRTARWVERRLPPGSGVTVAPWQALDLRAYGLTPPDVAKAAWWIDADGTRRRGHRAIAAALRAIGGPWRAVGAVIDVPPVSWLARLVYALVARFRDRMPGSTDSCRV